MQFGEDLLWCRWIQERSKYKINDWNYFGWPMRRRRPGTWLKKFKLEGWRGQFKASQSESKRVKASQSESKRVKASQSESKRVKASQSESKRVKASSSSTSGNHGNLLAKKEWEIRWGNRRFLAGKLNEKENCSHQKQIETNTWSGEWHCRREQSLIIVMRVVKSEEKLKGKFWGEKNRKQSRMSDSKSKGEIKEWNHDLLKGRKKAWGNILKRGKEEKRKYFWKGKRGKEGGKKRKWI